MKELESILHNLETRITSQSVASDTTTIKCQKCNDTKYIPVNNGDEVRYKRCQCYEAELEIQSINKLFKSARIPKRFQGKTLDNFHRERQPRAHDIAKKYINNWDKVADQGMSLFFVGPVGTGKSHLGFAILNELISRGVAGMAATVPDLMDDLRPKDGNEDNRMKTLKEVNFLLLDDLGAQRNSEWVTERLFVIINSRYSEQKPTVITSNNYLEDLAGLDGWKRITDRIVEMAHLVEMRGESFREQT